VAGGDGARVQAGHLVQRPQPFVQAAATAFGDVLVHVGQPPAGPLDPVTDGLDLGAGEGRVHQQCVVCPEDQRLRQRRPRQRGTVRHAFIAGPDRPVGDEDVIGQLGR
jgi:hypothetical protein